MNQGNNHRPQTFLNNHPVFIKHKVVSGESFFCKVDIRPLSQGVIAFVGLPASLTVQHRFFLTVITKFKVVEKRFPASRNVCAMSKFPRSSAITFGRGPF